MLEITKALTISTAHISEKTKEFLNNEATNEDCMLTVYPKSECGDIYGWFVYISMFKESNIAKYDTLPEDLRQCIAFALDHNCEILCFDSDAYVIPYLRRYD